MEGNDTINEVVLENAEDFSEIDKEYEIVYEQKKCETEFKSEIEDIRNDIKVNFGYDVLQVSDRHFTVNINPDIRYGTKDLQRFIVWPQVCHVSSISLNMNKLVYHKFSGLHLTWI